MDRRLWSLLVLVLLSLSAQVAARGDHEAKDDGGADDGHDGGDHEASDHEGDGKRGKDRDDEPAGAGHEGKKRTRHHDRPDDEREGKADEADEADAEPTNAAGVVGVASGSADGSPVRAAPSDLGLAILPTALPGRAQFSFLVSAVGAFDGARLSAALPDTGAPWTLSGPGAAACRLAGAQLDCTFDGFAPGDVRLVQASSPVARAPPWALSAAGQVGPAGGNAAAGDAVPGNDKASADLGLLLD